MPTVRELVSAIHRRPGIDGALVVARNGLVIAGDVSPHLDPNELAALVPPLLEAGDALAGPARTAVIEHERGHSVVLSLGDDAALVVLALPGADLAPVVTDLRRYREQIAQLV